MATHYIYITENIINGVKYIGQRKCPTNKSIEKDIYIGSGNRLVNAVNKYGKENFKKQVICYCNSQSMVDFVEIKLIKRLKVLENKSEWYNIDAGGQYNRGENHAAIISVSMKKLNENMSHRDKVIKGINKSRINKGKKPLMYSNYDEYLTFNIINKISLCNKRKFKKIKLLKSKSKRCAYNLYLESYICKEKRFNAAMKANKASLNKESIERRKQSQKDSWNKRKETNESVWNDKAKKSFSIGKCKQYNNTLGLWLINNNVPIWHNDLKNVIRVFSNRMKKGYKDNANMNAQAIKISSAISKVTGINISCIDIINNVSS